MLEAKYRVRCCAAVKIPLVSELVELIGAAHPLALAVKELKAIDVSL